MSLSFIDKEHKNDLFLSLYAEDSDKNYLEIVKSNHVHYGKLKMLSQQMMEVKKQAINIIEEAERQNELKKIATKFIHQSDNMY